MGFEMITINGKQFPAPDEGLEFVTTTIVDSTRNANAKVIAQKIGRDQYKINNLQWYTLDAKTWSELLQVSANFFIDVRFPDMVNNCFITLEMYVSDRTAAPCDVDSNGMPTRYRSCKFNIIDVGG